ncbi:hypothetical protein NCS57_00781000 [Fusarium keratoplasticum]|uniref:Uncharacterized protein n=1 Tax=Fusarium keratoplasticum TaxID=1328300 RepID=A0ACC0QYW9_9HYPO|nr:hypothetical protein NCS57_00781000 [Fusarium keratoplasticum]KAI8669653.1 hypothetical protein NCS57_00781000 [Fusarium keratoplasticum]KAI8674245.1 hypothetical protein NCS55_00747600 [Fusarium keratoplasticum]
MDSTNTTSTGSEWPLFNKYNEFPLDHIYTFCIFAYWVPHMFRMMKSKGYAKAHHYHRSLLIVHVIVSMVEVVLFHAKSWHLGHDPKANNFDLFLCVVQTITSLVMTERMRFIPKLTLELSRGSFQSMAFMRVLASGLAVYLESTEWHRASIKTLVSFVWVRFLLKWSSKFAGIDTREQAYSLSLISGILMGIYEGTYPHGIAIYMGTTLSLLAFDRWASKFDNPVIDSLRFVGLVSHRVERPSQEPEKPLKKVD